MQTCVVAVTRNGLGDMYLFDSFESADRHPIIQYGDVICRGPQHVLTQYNRLEIPDLLRRLGDEMFRSEVLMKLNDPAGPDEMLSRYAPRIWEYMCKCAAPPPEDAAEIVSIIRRDRVLSIKEGRAMNDKTKGQEANATTTTTAAAAPKEPAAKTYGGYPELSTITLLTDKDGKPYGKDNNPKRAGSKSATRFEAYKNGMTIKDAIAAGVFAADIPYDVAHNYITVTVPA